MKNMLISGKTHPGRRRKENQDACIHRQLWSADKALLAVIDGVGGYTGGERAAAIARDCIDQYMQIPRGDTLTMLREAITFANNRIVEERNNDQQVSEMCCVLTAVVADATAKCIYYVHVGDTRLYRFRNGSLQKLTKDHSFVGIKEDAGEISEMEAMHHPHRNQILREVGSTLHRLDDDDFMDFGREDFLPGDILLLCSDGLTDMITTQQITTILSAPQPLTGKVTNLIAMANEMGGHDNVTVVLLHHKQPVVKVAVTPIVEETVATAAPKKNDKLPSREPGKNKLLWAVLVLIVVTSAGWYLSSPKKPLVTEPDKTIYIPVCDTTTAMDSTRNILAARSVHPAVPGPVAPVKEEQTDTLRLESTQNLQDLERYADSTGKTLVLIPAKHIRKRFAAVAITTRSAKPGDTLLVKNLRLKDFETGIDVHVPVLLKTENLVFENIRYPFSYLFKRNDRSTPVLFTNTAKQ